MYMYIRTCMYINSLVHIFLFSVLGKTEVIFVDMIIKNNMLILNYDIHH